MKYTIGLDYGSDSCRAVIIDAETGNEIASSVKYYKRWAAGKYCDPHKNQYRQHPLDYIESLEEAVKEAQNGGSGVVIYFRKEGRALGEVTKYLVYNAR